MAGRTPHRTVRVADDVWQPAMERATENEETVSEVVRRALVEYVTPPPPEPERTDQ